MLHAILSIPALLRFTNHNITFVTIDDYRVIFKLILPKSYLCIFQTDGLQGLGELDDVWSIRKNVTIGGNNNKNISPRITNNVPTLASSPLTNNTGFYSRHAGGPPNNGGAKTGGQGISPTGSPREFPSRLHICK